MIKIYCSKRYITVQQYLITYCCCNNTVHTPRKGTYAKKDTVSLSEPQPHLGGKPVKLQVACPQNGTAVLNGLSRVFVFVLYCKVCCSFLLPYLKGFDRERDVAGTTTTTVGVHRKQKWHYPGWLQRAGAYTVPSRPLHDC